MYRDPNLVRVHRSIIRLNQYEHDFIQGLANLVGTAPATVIRELAFKQALADITLEPQFISQQQTNKDDKQTL